MSAHPVRALQARLLGPLKVMCVCAVLAALLLGCVPRANPEEAAAQRATALAETASALLTGTASALVTPATVAPPATAAPTSTDTPAPSATPQPAPATTAPEPTNTAEPCTNLSGFIKDVNVPDGTHFAPGAAFVKTWQLTNLGTCTWTADYQLRYIAGSAMGASSANLTVNVPPGALVDVSISLVAPAQHGTHIGRFQLHDPDGTAFGTRPYVEIIVP